MREFSKQEYTLLSPLSTPLAPAQQSRKFGGRGIGGPKAEGCERTACAAPPNAPQAPGHGSLGDDQAELLKLSVALGSAPGRGKWASNLLWAFSPPAAGPRARTRPAAPV